MKKIISMILALSVVLALAIPAFAADPENVQNGDNFTYEEAAGGTAKGNVTAKLDEGEDKTDPKDAAKVYSVNVAWEISSTLTYSKGTTTYTWNTEETQYDASTADDGWDGEASVKVTVTNKSNDDITASATWKAVGDIVAACSFEEAAEITVDSAAKNIEVITDGVKGEVQTGTITAKIAAPSEGTISEDNAIIGTITVTIKAAA